MSGTEIKEQQIHMMKEKRGICKKFLFILPEKGKKTTLCNI